MQTKQVKSSAPTRIDLAGGTLDIYPLYLFLGGGLTVNAAINLRSEVVLSRRNNSIVSIRCENAYSNDYNIPETFKLGACDFSGKLGLAKRIIKFYNPPSGVDIEIKTSAPPGAGLGGSSSMAVALAAALGRITAREYKGDSLADVVCNIEAQDLGVPAGRQDHYAALNGGFNAIRFDARGAHAEKLKLSRDFLAELRDKTALCYTGEPRFSGSTNWDMFKLFVDGNTQTRAALAKIQEIAESMRNALESEDFGAVCSALREEWEHRKALAHGVTTPQIEKIIAASRADAAKICGAGGGGCLILLGNADKDAVEKAGGRLIKFEFDEKGLEIAAR